LNKISQNPENAEKSKEGVHTVKQDTQKDLKLVEMDIVCGHRFYISEFLPKYSALKLLNHPRFSSHFPLIFPEFPNKLLEEKITGKRIPFNINVYAISGELQFLKIESFCSDSQFVNLSPNLSKNKFNFKKLVLLNQAFCESCIPIRPKDKRRKLPLKKYLKLN
jgi:hypothetical protein